MDAVSARGGTGEVGNPGDLAGAVGAVAAEREFSGVVRVDRGGEVALARAWGMAHRAHRIANTVETRFGIAGGTKGLTALAVVSLIEQSTYTVLANTAAGAWPMLRPLREGFSA